MFARFQAEWMPVSRPESALASLGMRARSEPEATLLNPLAANRIHFAGTCAGRNVTFMSKIDRTPEGHVPGRDERVSGHYVVAGQTIVAPPLVPGLHVVATPIGNLGDVTLRALEVLAGADLIACEDTRVTRRLLDHYGITTPLAPYHEHNAAAARPKLLARLAAGDAVALVSDAGTPLISDPGFKLAREAGAAGHAVTALPGASAVLAALAVSGLPTDRFMFEGFLPAREGQRRKRIDEIKVIPATLVLFETGPRIAAALADLAAALGPREAAICRELTKLYEEVRRGDLASLAREYAA